MDKIETSKEPVLITWLKVTITLTGLTTIGAVVYFCFFFRTIADVSLLHCVNIIKEEARLTEYEAILDTVRQDLDAREEKLKAKGN